MPFLSSNSLFLIKADLIDDRKFSKLLLSFKFLTSIDLLIFKKLALAVLGGLKILGSSTFFAYGFKIS